MKGQGVLGFEGISGLERREVLNRKAEAARRALETGNGRFKFVLRAWLCGAEEFWKPRRCVERPGRKHWG